MVGEQRTVKKNSSSIISVNEKSDIGYPLVSLSIIMIMPYFGVWPVWFNLFVESCKYNPTITWLFITDCGKPENKSDNVHYTPMSWTDCIKLVSNKLNINFKPDIPYKICDVRPAYGVIFSEYIKAFDFFGFGDIDVIYGNLKLFLIPKAFECDLITTNDKRVSGHFCLLRNTTLVKEKFSYLKYWKSVVEESKYYGIDEFNLESSSGNYFYGLKSVYAKDTYSTTSLPNFIGTRLEDRPDPPNVWHWEKGILWDDTREMELAYLHLIFLKNIWNSKNDFFNVKSYSRLRIDSNGISGS